jgi:hypothetical protein
MITRRFAAVACIALLAACGTASEQVTDTEVPSTTTIPATTLTTTTTSTSTTTSSPTTTVTHVMPDVHLTIEPSSGAPGDPLEVCYPGTGSTYRVTMCASSGWDCWPSYVDEFVTTNEPGRWCWTGVIPSFLESTEPTDMGELHPITSGTYQIRIGTFGKDLAHGELEVVVPDSGTSPPPSQTGTDAARDGVLPALADLPAALRVAPLLDMTTDQGDWMLARPSDQLIDSTMADGCSLGNLEGTYPIDVICTVEYGEVLLIDGTTIVRAYPMPGAIPSWLYVSANYVYAGHIGDGGLPDSTLVRIDRATLEATVVVIPAAFDGGSQWLPSWHIASADQTARYEALVQIGPDSVGTDALSYIGEVRIDPDGIDSLMDEVSRR